MSNDLGFIKPAAAGGWLAVHTKIGEETDSEGNNLRIIFSDSLHGTEAMPMFLRAYAELIEKGWADTYIPWDKSNSLQVVYAVNDFNRIVGGIAFEYRSSSKEGWLMLSFTDPECRGRRINQALHKYFEAICLKRGATHISSYVHVNNTPRIKSAARVNFVPSYYKMTKLLKKLNLAEAIIDE
jgi:GNAT superfamily N-acetyltransferase